MPTRVQGELCKYFEICGRVGTWAEGGDCFCILHLPIDNKNHQELTEALREHRGEGCDFREMVFPAGFGPLVFEAQHFQKTADFRGIRCVGLNVSRSRFDGEVLIDAGFLKVLSFYGATIKGRLSVKAEGVEGSLDLAETTAFGPVDITVPSGIELRLRESRFRDTVSVSVSSLRGDLDWSGATFGKGMTLTANQCRNENLDIDRATFTGCLDMCDCRFTHPLDLSGARFNPFAVIDLSRAKMPELTVRGSHLPHEIRCNGTTVDGRVAIGADLEGAACPRIVGRESRPRFGATVQFTNVDLSECLLVGNPIQNMECSGVIWPSRYGRFVLADEVAIRHAGYAVSLEKVEEAYQILKQKSQAAGDHMHAGDFHYGELEMRRHRRSSVGSVLCLEFFYWLFSGYGTRPGRAAGAIAILMIVGAALYRLFGGIADTTTALRTSVAVSTLQRRDVAVDSWITVVQTVVAAVLIALLVLAVRMRLKR